MAIRNNQAPGVYVEEVPSGNAPIAGVGTSTAGFVGVLPDAITIPDPVKPDTTTSFTVPAKVGDVRLVTNLTEFRDSFGDFSLDPGQSLLAHGVRGFLLNGGTRCFVTRVVPGTDANGKPDYT